MLKKIALVLLLAVAALCGYAALQPDSFTVARAQRIAAPPAKLQALIDDFRQWPQWSPWERRDPAMKRTFEGAAAGKGAVYAWDGSNEVGAGRMEILETSPAKIVIKLDFSRPFEGHNIAEFALVPDGAATDVTWTMRGPSAFVTKLMGVFFDMDKMIGRDFEAGLAAMKTAAEK
jgi:hypothetical protein